MTERERERDAVVLGFGREMQGSHVALRGLLIGMQVGVGDTLVHVSAGKARSGTQQGGIQREREVAVVTIRQCRCQLHDTGERSMVHQTWIAHG